MIKTRLIPVLYIKNGLIVRSEDFSYHQNIGNIINEASRYNEWNVDELIYIDISRTDEYDLRRDDHKIKSYSSKQEIISDWPAPATPWLALDRDRSGSIDDGRELFGSGSVLASGGYGPHGFAALAELDGDHEGALTPSDPAWRDLVLWADHDADRRSTHWELLPLASFAIEAIDLGFTRTRDCDARGNCGAERAAFRYRSHGRSQRGEVIDVHLRCE